MRYSITSNWRIYQIYNWEKYVFHWKKSNFERIGNSVQTAELVAQEGIFISTTIWYFTQSDNMWKHDKQRAKF